MSKIQFRAAFLSLSLLAGCSTRQTPIAEEARTEMVGMSVQELSTCLGQPRKKAAISTTEVWSYTYGVCTVNLQLANDRVKDASYSVPADATLSVDEQCEKVPVVASCLRWLRGSSIFTEGRSTDYWKKLKKWFD